MNPELKAKELIEKMCDASHEDYCSNVLATAKRCALICVDEILKAVTTIADKKYDFYLQVKTAIEKY